MECCTFRVKDEPPVYGFTAGGEPLRVLPGDYKVHLRQPSAIARRVGPALRFIGANPRGGDVFVPVPGATAPALPPVHPAGLELVSVEA
jgi:hypothetical protein